MRIRTLFVPIMTFFLVLAIVSPSIGFQNNALLAAQPVEIFQASPLQGEDGQPASSLFDKISTHKAEFVVQSVNQRSGEERVWQPQLSQGEARLLQPQFEATISGDAPATVAPNGEITYSLLVTNRELAPITDVYIYSYLPFDTAFVQADEPYEVEDDLYYWYVEMLEVDESVQVSFTVRVPNAPGEEIFLDAYGVDYISELNDPGDPGDFYQVIGDLLTTTISGSSGSTPTPAVTPDGTPGFVGDEDIGITVSGPSTAQPGGQITYELMVTNSSATAAEELYILNFVPADTEVVETSQNYEGEYDPSYDAVA